MEDEREYLREMAYLYYEKEAKENLLYEEIFLKSAKIKVVNEDNIKLEKYERANNEESSAKMG